MGPCMCGALDCIACHPEYFRDGRYTGEDDEEERNIFDELWNPPEVPEWKLTC